MYEVILTKINRKRVEHLVRVVYKHNRNMTHHEHEAVVSRVAAGGQEVVVRYEEKQTADNVVAEFAYHGAVAEVRSVS